MTKQFVGKVVSTSMQKTVVVLVQSQRRHPLYKKLVRRSKRFKVHNEDANVKIGNIVRIEETRPLSKEKHFKVLEVIR